MDVSGEDNCQKPHFYNKVTKNPQTYPVMHRSKSR